MADTEDAPTPWSLDPVGIPQDANGDVIKIRENAQRIVDAVNAMAMGESHALALAALDEVVRLRGMEARAKHHAVTCATTEGRRAAQMILDGTWTE